MTALTMRDFRSNLATSFYSISLFLVLLNVAYFLFRCHHGILGRQCVLPCAIVSSSGGISGGAEASTIFVQMI